MHDGNSAGDCPMPTSPRPPGRGVCGGAAAGGGDTPAGGDEHGAFPPAATTKQTLGLHHGQYAYNEPSGLVSGGQVMCEGD